jgi:hypothetical protein
MVTWVDGWQRQSWGTTGGTFTGGPAKGVLHTTETTGWPGYANGQSCPHLTIFPNWTTKKLDVRQHVPLNVASRALVNKTGGVQTNRDGAIQIELIGTCNPEWRGRTGYFYWPEAPEWALVALGTIMRSLEKVCGIRRLATSPWLAYPRSYGSAAGQRMTLSQWDAFSGWCGHQHVPENEHGDPGNLNITRLLANAPVAAVATLPVAQPVIYRDAPRFPLPEGHVFGPRSSAPDVHSGYTGSWDRDLLRVWQAQMRRRFWEINVDGLFGPQTASVATAFKQQKGIGVDPRVGPQTWAAAWTAPLN